MSAAVDGTVLRGHNGLDGGLALHVTSKPRDLWGDNDDLCKNANTLDLL